MEFFDVIARRGSYRGEFEQSSIPQEELYRILDAGIRAPSGYNLQTATFYAVTDELLRRSLAEIFPTKAVQTAPVILVVTSQCIHSGDHNLQFETEDYAAATENIMLAITASGYAGVWMDGMMKFDGHTDAVRQLLHIPDSETPRTIIPFGKPAGPVSQRPKKAFLWGDRIFEKCGIGRDEGGDGGKTLEIRGKRRLSARDGGANYQQS